MSPGTPDRAPLGEKDLRSFYQGRRVLLTGVNGFLGSHLIRRLSELGACGAGIHRPGSDLARLQPLDPKVRWIPADLRDREALGRAVRDFAPTIVFHVAARGVDPALRDLEAMFMTNVVGLVNLLDALEGVPFEGFVNTGTCSEYGPRGTEPRLESEPPDPVSAYGISKASAVMLGVNQARARDWPIVTLRPFTTYGPFERPDRLVGYAMACVLRGQEMRATGGKQARDFIYVEDVVEAYLRAAIPPVASGEIINVGSGQVVTIAELIQKVCQISGTQVPVRLGALPYREDEIWHLCADIRRARKLLGWAPQVSLEEGLRRTLRWYRQSFAGAGPSG